MKSNPFYLLIASPRSVAPTLLRWALAAALLLEIIRVSACAAGIVQWQIVPVFKAFSTNLFPVLATPFAVSRIVVASGLILGFFTRMWAILTVVLAVLSYQAHGGVEDHIWLLEYLVVVCGGACALAILGGGRGSLDKAISERLLPRIG